MDVATPPRSHTSPAAELRAVPLRAWLAAHPERAVTWGAVVLLVLQAVQRGWVAYGAAFYYDDLIFHGMSATAPGPTLDYLLTAHNSHVMPGSFAWVMAVERLAPYDHAVVVTIDLLVQAAAGWALFLVLRRLFGARPAVLPLLALGLFTCISLQATLWWAVALNQLPQLLAMSLALLAFLRHVESGSWRSALGVGAAVTLGLAFSERTALVAPLLAVLAVGWFARGTAGRRALTALRDHWRVWVVLVLLLGPYTAYYLLSVPSPTEGPDASLGLTVSVVVEALEHALVPALLGGPWSWRGGEVAYAAPSPGPLLRGLALAAVVAVVLLSVLRRRGAGRAWLLLLGSAVVMAVVLSTTRATFVGPVAAREYRYFTEIALVAPLAVGLALLPLRVRPRRGPVDVLQPRPLPAPLARAVAAWRPLWRPLARSPLRTSAAAALALVALSTVSVAAYAPHWQRNPVDEYLAHARAALAQAPDAPVLDTAVPDDVLPGLAAPWNTTARVLAPYAPPDRFLTVGEAAETVRVLDEQGRAAPALVTGPKAPLGPVPDCGWLVRGRPTTVPLDARTFDGLWLLRLDYLAGAATTARVTAGDETADVVLRPGLNPLHVAVSGVVDEVVVEGVPEQTPVCVTGAVVGLPVPAP